MEYLKIEGEFPKLANCAVTMGKFDGIHRGHCLLYTSRGKSVPGNAFKCSREMIFDNTSCERLMKAYPGSYW